jgi:predicted nucleotidyltransferase
MSINLKTLEQQKLIHPPKWLVDNVHYMTIMGSHAYGTETPESDMDVYGWCIPPKNTLFPWLNNLVYGFDNFPNFDQWQEHHVIDESALGGRGREYDFGIYNITRYFYLCASCNPNMIDSLFTPQNCIE